MTNAGKMLRNKTVWLGMILVLIVILILGLAQIGSSSNPAPKNMPVALVVLDQGAQLPNGQTLNIGKLILDNVTKPPADGEEPPLKWEVLQDVNQATSGLDEEKYYATLVLPADLSRNVASLFSPQPQAAEIQVSINQGMNATGANLVSQIVSKIGEGVNANLRTQMLGNLKAQGDKLNTAQAAALAAPISFKIDNVNPVPSHSANGNAPVAFTVLAWFGAIVTSVLLMLASNKARSTGRLGNVGVIVTQLVLGLLYAGAAAGSTLLLAKGMLGMTIPDAGAFFWTFALISYCFFLMQSCLLNWLGMAGMPLLVLVFFFGSPILALPPQMLPSFSHDWLYSWIPLHFGADVLRDLLYFGKGLNTGSPLTVLTVTAGIALVLSLLSAVVKSYGGKVEVQQNTHA
ncbi:YhgE/Pip domain-containing protein [Tumebacillus flagellatus]|uniref:ABC-2 type transporter transmembrane domain-containing protein n=1 Tax=Tumebacillus flagellatus TaxID=1157490 RepID=A0A074LYL7_9BACL|nr:ABC transporter permease [Tumebacillus flagellatus]KEO85103.1 hypothetical protein EL26_00645 [Tumebacillus flagellatus]